MPRKARFDAFDEGARHGPYDEYPMLPPGADPQIHVSRNDRKQPFWLMCEHDTVLITMSGTGRVEFAAGPSRYHTVKPGDFLYVPGGTEHRIAPDGECIQLRYKAEHPGLEGVAWHCESCSAELAREVWDTNEELPQEGYLRACRAFNADAARRACKGCGAVHPPLELAPYRWEAIAREIRADLAEAAAKPAKAAG